MFNKKHVICLVFAPVAQWIERLATDQEVLVQILAGAPKLIEF